MATVSCLVRFGKPFHHYNLRGLTVQEFCLGKGLVRLSKRHGCVVGLDNSQIKFALTDN